MGGHVGGLAVDGGHGFELKVYGICFSLTYSLCMSISRATHISAYGTILSLFFF